MSKFAINRGLPRPRPNTSRSVVTSNVHVVTKASKTADKRNLAGGQSFSMSDKMELVVACLCWAMFYRKDGKGRCYESEDARIARIRTLIPKAGAEFAAKLALLIRIRDGGRSISHILAALIAPYASGEPWAAEFYRQVAVRADDMCEIAAAIWKFNGSLRSNQVKLDDETRKAQNKLHEAAVRIGESRTAPAYKKMKLPRALLRGFAKRFNQLDEYRLAKYANKCQMPALKNLFMLCHAKPADKVQSKLFEKLLTDKLVNTDTWEAQLSAAGQEGTNKADAWASLVANRKLGPLALLKNLRNIAEHCAENIVDAACDQLRDAQLIKNCGILPAQYLTAYQAVAGTKYAMKLKLAIDDSVEIACGNVPSIGKRVLIAIDESGSMTEIEREPAAIFAATLLKSNPKADVMFFAGDARYQEFNRKLPIMELIQQIRSAMRDGSTNFNAIFNKANKAYDTIVILSDAEGWMKGEDNSDRAGAPTLARQKYATNFGVNPRVFSFDLGGDGSLMFRQDSIILLAGASFLVFRLLNYLNQERTTLVDAVDKVEIGKPMPTFNEDED